MFQFIQDILIYLGDIDAYSKTIFKNLSRCHNFISLYDLYINRGLHNIKEIEGNKVEQDIEKTIFTLKDNLFDVKNEKIEEIFQEMFDEKRGMIY